VNLLTIKGFLKAALNRDTIESTIKWRIVDKFFSAIPRSKLKSKDFSIIGNNCFAGGMYHKFGLPYNTPTIWTYIYPEDYLRLLENLDYYLKQPLTFKTETNHTMAKKHFQMTHRRYPIGVLGSDVEIHFMHYKTEAEAAEKWNRRLKRLNRDNLFFVFSDGEEFSEELLERYQKLPYFHKIFFSCKPYSEVSGNVYVEDYAKEVHVYDSTRNRRYEKYLDLVKWLNKEEVFLKHPNR
jgi:uncharacterized protein (DUF1919 family)